MIGLALIALVLWGLLFLELRRLILARLPEGIPTPSREWTWWAVAVATLAGTVVTMTAAVINAALS